MEFKNKIRAFARANGAFLAFVLMMVSVRATLANQYLVPTGSMEPTIAVGDRIFVNRVAYDLKVPFAHRALAQFSEPERGDIVVFDSVTEPSMVLVKRLIGLPGDEIDVIDGCLLINDEKVSFPEEISEEVNGKRFYPEQLGNHGFRVQRIMSARARIRPLRQHFIVPKGHYFFMGDNRDNSNDSRFWGFVPRSHLIGRAERVLYSLDMSKPITEMVSWDRLGAAL